MGLLAPSSARDGDLTFSFSGPPSVTVLLPPSIPSETVQIAFVLPDTLAEYGSYGVLDPGLDSFKIDASVNGKWAREVRLIVYAAGCEIQTFVVPLEANSAATEEFECAHVPDVALSGQIVPSKLAAKKNAELAVMYDADPWGINFLGGKASIIPEFKVASVFPKVDGTFEVNLPYFTVDAEALEPQATLRLELIDSDTGMPIAYLEPELSEFDKQHELAIRPSYPSGLKFKAF
jgi:hypothetical protein